MPIDESLPFIPVNIAVLTVSDTRDMASDRSGQTLQDRIEAAGHRCVAREIVRDEADDHRGRAAALDRRPGDRLRSSPRAAPASPAAT